VAAVLKAPQPGTYSSCGGAQHTGACPRAKISVPAAGAAGCRGRNSRFTPGASGCGSNCAVHGCDTDYRFAPGPSGPCRAGSRCNSAAGPTETGRGLARGGSAKDGANGTARAARIHSIGGTDCTARIHSTDGTDCTTRIHSTDDTDCAARVDSTGDGTDCTACVDSVDGTD
jgi:hypothetical protein